MKKIGWFRRLFMSWKDLVRYFGTEQNDPSVWQKLVEHYEKTDKEKDILLEERKSEIDHLKNEVKNLDASTKALNSQYNDKEQDLRARNLDIDNLRAKLLERQQDLETIKNDILNKLSPLAKIEKTFFASSGNKGKGELGERQLKSWLEKSGMDHEMWTENLIVGSNQVEFAIKADLNDKWIPVDSKVLDPDFDEDNKFIINDAYKARVQNQVKEVAKYLSKTNTADYGLLVLQNDNIYINLFDQYPAFFEQVIKEWKIFICSPSTFIQFAWTMSNILEIYRKIHKDEKLFDEVVEVLVSVNKLASNLSATHKTFNIAMSTHYPTLKRRQTDLVKKLVTNDKIKELPILGSPEDAIESEEDKI